MKYFNCLSSITNDTRCTREIKSRIALVKAALNKKSLFNSKLEVNLKGGGTTKLYIWIRPLYGAETWTLWKLRKKYPESFEMYYCRRTEKINSADCVRNEVLHRVEERTAVAQWLRCCATNRRVAGSIPAGVSGFFIDVKTFRSHYGPAVDSASNRNEYQEYFVGVKAAGA